MQRRRFMSHLAQALTVIGAAPAIARAASANRLPAHVNAELNLQDCRTASSHYCGCHAVLDHLRPDDPLQLRRQPDNPYDSRAVEVFRREHQLGHLPRLDNAAAASLLDRAHVLHAEVIGIDDLDEMWEPVRLRVWASLDEVEQRI